MPKITKFKLPSANKRVIRICSYCLENLINKSIKLDHIEESFFNHPTEKMFYSKKCKNKYITNNPIVEKQIKLKRNNHE
ncbi:MAG: hypothetical protein GF317_05900 [Candidatus Lokiarchaeota archaeon]|nr:hypothetical protein [Candidatus Lokiarchaeota archaeon]